MCGVTGFWAPGLEEASAQVMAQALAHRGPDDSGVLRCGVNGPVLAHRRLSIIDLSPAGHQPMTSASGRYVITFNGEVFNFAALRKELERAGKAPPWRGSSDTEVMLAAIEAWGLEPAVGRFIGMFAFALWDGQEQRLHLVRDRVGIKPLYWSKVERGLGFGSELKALRRLPGFVTRINRVALAGFLRANCVPGEASIFEETRRVLPGTFLTFSAPTAAPTTTRYWDAVGVARASLAEPFQGTEREAIEQLDSLLRDAVKLRLVSDVPLGAFLSGGIDSSTVVALMQVQSEIPVHTFSIENETADFDEGTAARAVARHLNTHHTSLKITARDALDVIPRLPMMYDEPFADSSQIPTFLVAQLARRDVTVVLSGDGGDEYFGGYMRHQWGPRLWQAERLLPGPARRALSSLITARSPGAWDALFEKLGGVMPAPRLPGIRLHKAASVLSADSPEAMHAILSSHWLPSEHALSDQPLPMGLPIEPLVRGGGAGVAEEMMIRDTIQYLPDDILTKVDRATMAVSLEAREPLLDHRLFAFAWRLPSHLRIRGGTGKWILRQVLARYVPPEILSSSKMGFGIPLGAWLRGPLRDWAEGLLAPSRLREHGFNVPLIRARWDELLHGQRPWEYHLWDILMFQAWSEAQAQVGESQASFFSPSP
ncbi:MAG: asparagine synthase (glutamine-hydrolyzing) [Myxococcales bacterium]|nr:asparagine synthase (glutamine-hydrolyzing) [Myxococcales bacterium]